MNKTELRARIERVSHKMVDALEGIVDQLTPEPPARSRAAERRQLANLLGASRFCARRGCRRAHCCLGEPSECLRILMPVLDGGRLAGLLQRRRRPRRCSALMDSARETGDHGRQALS